MKIAQDGRLWRFAPGKISTLRMKHTRLVVPLGLMQRSPALRCDCIKRFRSIGMETCHITTFDMTFGRSGHSKSQRSCRLCASRFGQSPLSCPFCGRMSRSAYGRDSRNSSGLRD
jgi:hypothetical protein